MSHLGQCLGPGVEGGFIGWGTVEMAMWPFSADAHMLVVVRRAWSILISIVIGLCGHHHFLAPLARRGCDYFEQM